MTMVFLVFRPGIAVYLSLHAQTITAIDTEQPVEEESSEQDEKTDFDHYFFQHQSLIQAGNHRPFFAGNQSHWCSGHFPDIICPPPEQAC
ncbi:MAG: hypothetical protein R3C61_19545 [Bacteroidia bacterium]